MTTALHIRGKNLKSDFPTFEIKKRPPQGVLITLSDALAFSAGALFLRTYCNFAREMRAIMFDAANSIRSTGKIPRISHPGVLKRVDIRIEVPSSGRMHLILDTDPVTHKDERAFQASVAAMHLCYLGYVLSDPNIDRRLIDYSLERVIEMHPNYIELDWLPIEFANAAQQSVVTELVAIWRERL